MGMAPNECFTTAGRKRPSFKRSTLLLALTEVAEFAGNSAVLKASHQRVTVMSFLRQSVAAAVLLVAGALLGQEFSTTQKRSDKELPAALVRANDAAVTRGDWGHWLRYFRGDTHGSRDLVVLAVTLKPGQAPHPAHQHAEEELMILATGTGEWRVDDKELPAKAGDVVYARPWTMHGIKNTGDEPLVYYMVKWSSKGVPAAERPNE
jgi:mannose-6-phosphate isomerase-like protein (cupin superfamily)